MVEKILEAGRWAPSGLNNQPWRFEVLENEQKNLLARYTKYGHIIENADKVILVFLDRGESYNYEKDLMAIGACIQNMLLCAHSLKLGTCWLGEILKRREEIGKKMKLPAKLQLEAVIALGKPLKYPSGGKRQRLKKLIVLAKRGFSS